MWWYHAHLFWEGANQTPEEVMSIQLIISHTSRDEGEGSYT